MKWIKCIAIGIIYFLLGRASALTVPHGILAAPSLAWMPTGFAVAAVLLEGYWVWPGIALGSLLNATPTTMGWLAVLSFMAANTIDPLLATWLPRQILGRNIDFCRRRDVTVFILVVVGVSSVLSAFIGSITLSLLNFQPTSYFGSTWLIWWISDFMGVLIIVPLILAWRRKGEILAKTAGWAETFLGWLVGVLLVLFIFSMPLGRNTQLFIYWLVPFVIWLSFRGGNRESATGIFLLSIVTIWATVLDLGPFIGQTPRESFLYVQSFLAAISVLGLLLVAAVAERERAIQDRDDFFLLASHELKTPLATLSMQSHFMMELIEKNEMEKISGDRRKEMIQINARELKNMADLVDDLLLGARIAAGKLGLEPQETDLYELVQSALLEQKEQVRAAGVQIRLNGNSLPGVWDTKKISFVIKTLLKNGLKYGAGKPIEVSLRKVGEKAELVVVDHGIGISEELMPRIFNRFGHLVPLRYFGGLKQGLFISKAITRAHGGEIYLESIVGDGAKFTVELPLRPPRSAIPVAGTPGEIS
jgi:signal transduction histidine kinase